MLESTGWPLYVYLYDETDHYTDPFEVGNEFALQLILKTAVLQAVREKRQVRITDPDDFCVFHAEKGKVLFPKEIAHLFEKGESSNG